MAVVKNTVVIIALYILLPKTKLTQTKTPRFERIGNKKGIARRVGRKTKDAAEAK